MELERKFYFNFFVLLQKMLLFQKSSNQLLMDPKPKIEKRRFQKIYISSRYLLAVTFH